MNNHVYDIFLKIMLFPSPGTQFQLQGLTIIDANLCLEWRHRPYGGESFQQLGKFNLYFLNYVDFRKINGLASRQPPDAGLCNVQIGSADAQ